MLRGKVNIIQIIRKRRVFLVEEAVAIYAARKISESTKQAVIGDCRNGLSELEQIVSSLFENRAAQYLSQLDKQIWKDLNS